MKHSNAENGFSLIEVVVALGVLSTAAVSLSMTARQSIAGAKLVEARFLARTVAEAQLTETFTKIDPLEIGVEGGQMQQLGQSFEWTRIIAESGREGLLLVQVDVTPKGEDVVLAQISTLKRSN